jgi:hypothetical protein
MIVHGRDYLCVTLAELLGLTVGFIVELLQAGIEWDESRSLVPRPAVASRKFLRD